MCIQNKKLSVPEVVRLAADCLYQNPEDEFFNEWVINSPDDVIDELEERKRTSSKRMQEQCNKAIASLRKGMNP